MRNDRPSLRGRLTALDAKLASPAATRGLATLVGALLLVQGAVVLDRSGSVPGAPEISALEPAAADTTDTAADTSVEVASAPLVADVAEGSTDTTTAAGDSAADTAAAAAPAATARQEQQRTPAHSASSRTSTGTTAASSDPARQRFESRFPEHARAGQNTAKPGTTRWAVLIGVNEHSGRTRDNVGSRQDAEDLARHLLSLGWARDHVLLLTDGNANRENIVQALRWLQRKSNEHSVVVVHYSGHVKQWHGRDVDGDGEVTDEAFWPSDNRFITDREVGELLGRIRHQRMWFNVGGCEAAGFNDWGTTGPNRIVTWSSAEHQKSYEEPSKRNSVWGWQMIEEGFINGRADANGDGNVTVEEAFRFATPRADQRTRGQSHGRQTPQVSDRLKGEFDLRIPPPPRPRSEPKPSEDDDDRPSCLLCPPGTAVPALRWR